MTLKHIARYVSITCLFLIPLFAILAPSNAAHPIFPASLINGLFFPFITGKAFYFRLLVEVAFASWLILAFLDTKYRPRINLITIAVSIFALVVLLADLLGVNPVRSLWSNFERMEGWVTIIHLWAFFMVSTSLFGDGEVGKRLWHRFLNMSLIVAGIVAIYAIVQLSGGAQIHQGSRIDASLGNAAYLAVYMLFHFFIAAYMFFVAKAKKIANADLLVWVYPIASIVFGYLLIETATRGTILGLIGGILLSLVLYAIFGGKKKEDKKWRWISLGIILFIILVGILFWVNRDAKFIQNHEALRRMASISLSENQTQARAYIWPVALKGAMERPLFGWGQENFNYIFNANYNPKMWAQEQWFDRAHSVFIDWLVASGIVGFIVYLSLYVLAIWAIWKSSATVSEKSIITGLISGYAVHNIFVFDNLASYILFFTVLGFVSCMENTKKTTVLFEKRVASPESVEYIISPIIIILMVLSIYFVNIRIIQANGDLIKALVSCQSGKVDPSPFFKKVFALNAYTANQESREQLMICAQSLISSQSIPGPMKQSIFSLAQNEIQAQISATPKDARVYVLAGSFYIGTQQPGQALTSLKKADELSPNKQSIEVSLAEAYLQTGDIPKSLEILKKAYESSTDNKNVRNSYIKALVISGKESEAREMFKDDLSIFESDQMAQIYYSLKQYDKTIAILKKLVANNPKNAQYRAGLADVQNTAGYKWEAIQTLTTIGKDFPEYKTQVEAAIKQIQK